MVKIFYMLVFSDAIIIVQDEPSGLTVTPNNFRTGRNGYRIK